MQTIATGRSLKDLEKKRDESISEATKGINKHYRRASVKVHPDRFGDTYKKEFDALIKARDSLLDVELRHKYLEQMLEVLCKVGTRWMKQAHDSFVQKNLNPKSTDTEPGTKQQPLQIEGGLMYTTPKKPVVAILKASERKIRVSLRIPAGLAYEFRRHCQSVRIVGSRADLTTDKAFAKTFTKEHFYSNMDDFIMECDLTLPDAGVWDLRWSYTVESEPGNPHTSECSVDTRVDLVSPKTQAKINLMKSFEKSAIRRTSEIRAAIQKLGKITGSHTDIRKKYSTLQEAILKGRHIEFHLEKSMRQAGVDTASMTTPLYALREVLHRTLPYKTELDKSLAAFEKKAAYKSFKTDIYDILESGDASTWIATVSNECLQKDMKGDANRLYQLLMEGKKAYSLELVDADTLFAAAERKDLFTAKQLQDLLKRADEMEGVAAQEAFRLAAEEEKRCQEDAKIQNMKERAGSMELDRGCLVRIEGIKNEPSLNGILVTYMGLGEGDRYILRMHSGREIALRQENFYQWDGIGPAIFVPPPNKDEVWACDACTFYHDGLDAKKLTSCSVCGAPRDEKAKRDTVGRKQNVGASRVKSNIKKTNAATLSGVEDTSLSPDIKTAIDRIAKSPTHSAELETQQHAVRPEALSDSSPVVSPDRQPKTEPGGGKEKPTKHLKKCKFGKRCKHLTNGLCKFQHSCEETAAAQGREPDFKPFIGQQKAPDDVSEPERPAAAAVATAATHKVERTLMIDSGAVGRIIGYRGKTLLEIGRRSGAKVRVHHKKVDADGLVRVDLKGDTQESVDIAASMVEKKVVLNKDKPPSKVPVPSNDGNGCCVLGGNPTNGKANVPDRDATPKVEAKSRGSTTKKQGVGKKKARSGRGPVDLAAFLHSNENALKCSSITFFNWLKNNDISTVSDLAEACIDEEFVEELVSHGLKRFKLGSFEKRAAAWARAAEEAK